GPTEPSWPRWCRTGSEASWTHWGPERLHPGQRAGGGGRERPVAAMGPSTAWTTRSRPPSARHLRGGCRAAYCWNWPSGADTEAFGHARQPQSVYAPAPGSGGVTYLVKGAGLRVPVTFPGGALSTRAPRAPAPRGFGRPSVCAEVA